MQLVHESCAASHRRHAHRLPPDFQTAQNTRIRVEWKSGASAHDWEQVAKKDNLNFLQTELLSLEQSVHDIHIELQRIRRKEEEMRDINGGKGGWCLDGLCAVSLIAAGHVAQVLILLNCRGNKCTCGVAGRGRPPGVPRFVWVADVIPAALLQAQEAIVSSRHRQQICHCSVLQGRC